MACDGVSQITRPFCQLGSIILTVLLKVSSLNVFILLDECTTRNTSMIFHLKYLDNGYSYNKGQAGWLVGGAVL